MSDTLRHVQESGETRSQKLRDLTLAYIGITLSRDVFYGTRCPQSMCNLTQ